MAKTSLMKNVVLMQPTTLTNAANTVVWHDISKFRGIARIAIPITDGAKSAGRTLTVKIRHADDTSATNAADVHAFDAVANGDNYLLEFNTNIDELKSHIGILATPSGAGRTFTLTAVMMANDNGVNNLTPTQRRG